MCLDTLTDPCGSVACRLVDIRASTPVSEVKHDIEQRKNKKTKKSTRKYQLSRR